MVQKVQYGTQGLFLYHIVPYHTFPALEFIFPHISHSPLANIHSSSLSDPSGYPLEI